jgi:drug/metabolite transporter (DMT)-like permease
MAKVLIILLGALVLEAFGVVLLSRALKDLGELRQFGVAEILQFVKRGATHPALLGGIALEAAFFGALLYLLSQRDVSLIWPLTSLGFVITALAARWLLNEEVSWIRWSGVGLIVIGACLVSYSELVKSRQVPVPGVSAGDRLPDSPVKVRS